MRKFTIGLLLALVSGSMFTQTILGYLPSYRDPNAVQYDKLTDIVYSFINPDTDGSLITWKLTPDYLDKLYGFNMNGFLTVKQKSSEINLWLAVGGADQGEQRAARLNSVTASNNYRTTFISELISFAAAHNLYGLSIDWEFPKTPTAKNNHEKFLKELTEAIAVSSKPNLKVSIAVGGETKGTVNHKDYINSNAIQYADEVHIMAYDFPVNNVNYDANHHSSLADGKGAFDGWEAFGIPKSKMILCIPFYGRSANRVNEIEYNLFPDNITTFTNDYYNGYYYNGKTTLEAKTEYVMTQGGMGVAIWDLGQDKSNSYSLLSAVNAKMNSLCPAPQPKLGPDQGVCGDINLVLDADVATASGRTFSWTRNGVSVSGSSNTLTITQEGVYEVIVSQGGCERTDVIEVANGSPLSATGNEGCKGDDISLTVDAASGNDYEWYDAASLSTGVKVGDGATYTVTNAQQTKSYYVQEKTSAVTYTDLGMAGPPPGLANSPWAWAEPFGKRAHWVEFYTDLTINSVDIWYQGNITGVKLVVVDELGNEVTSSSPVSLTGVGSSGNWESTAATLNANIAVSAGKYLLTVVGSTSDGGIIFQSQQGISGATKVDNGYTLTGEEIVAVAFIDGTDYWKWDHTASDGTFDAWPISAIRDETADKIHYGTIFNMVFTAGAASTCPRAEATIVVNECIPLGVVIESPSDGDNIGTDVSFDITAQGDIASVVYEINDGSTTTTVSGEALNGYDLDYTFAAVGDYTITVRVIGTDASEVTKSISVTVVADAITLIIDSPSDNETVSGNVSFDVTTTGDIASVVYEITKQGGSTKTVNGESSNDHDIDYVFNEAGNYDVKVTATGTNNSIAVQSISLTVNQTGTGFESITTKNAIEVYPNPATDIIHVKGNSPFEYIITDMRGVELMNGSTESEINIVNLESGLYILQIQTNGEVKTTSFMKN